MKRLQQRYFPYRTVILCACNGLLASAFALTHRTHTTNSSVSRFMFSVKQNKNQKKREKKCKNTDEKASKSYLERVFFVALASRAQHTAQQKIHTNGICHQNEYESKRNGIAPKIVLLILICRECACAVHNVRCEMCVRVCCSLHSILAFKRISVSLFVFISPLLQVKY